VDGWGRFSSPEILSLKVLCGPVSEVLPRHLCRKRD
jgi:hypothetical protein